MGVVIIFASQYDPHLYPARGPFFEGWYARMTDLDHTMSFGVLFGEVLPKTNNVRTLITLDQRCCMDPLRVNGMYLLAMEKSS